MAYTPIIRPLNQNGTTFYTFSSAARDLSKCMASSTKEFVFTHFVCLNIPDIINTTQQNASGSAPSDPHKNYTQLGGVHGMLQREAAAANPVESSTELAESLQDYVFNFEEKLISESEDNDTDRSVAERVFWHWMRETGAIRWNNDSNKVAPALISLGKTRYTEESGGEYKNVVKYIGNIDITNNVDYASNAYTEIYVHIPSEHGGTPYVLFEQEFDGNYKESATYTVSSNPEFILGQSSDGAYPVSVKALYDTGHSYVTGSSVGPSAPQNVADTTSYGAHSVNILKSQLDGVCVDFDANSYRDIVMRNLNNIDEFNRSGDSFEFNAVLVYYDIVDMSSGKRTSNLYGVLFLDDVKSETWDYLQRYPKYKPLENAQNGNSYGFKLNLRVDVEPGKTGITSLVNEYNTFSMSLFADAMARMQECAEMFTRTRSAMNAMESRLSDLETVMSAMADYETLALKVAELEKSLENANLAFADRSSLLDLIAHVSDNVDSVVNGRASVALQYNTDVIHGGYNTEVDNSVPNAVTINSVTSGYNIMRAQIGPEGPDITADLPMNLDDQDREDNDIYAILGPMSNMLRIYTEEIPAAAHDINIFVDPGLNPWRAGQNLRVVFPNMSRETLNGMNVTLVTGDAFDVKETVGSSELSDRPIIEFTCVDQTLSNSHPFVHDVLR